MQEIFGKNYIKIDYGLDIDIRIDIYRLQKNPQGLVRLVDALVLSPLSSHGQISSGPFGLPKTYAISN
jgi:hypothetical protein